MAWSNYLPDQGVLVPLRTREQEQRVMGWLRAQPAVVSVTDRFARANVSQLDGVAIALVCAFRKGFLWDRSRSPGR